MLECSLDFCKASDEMPQVLTAKLKKCGQVDGGLSGLKKFFFDWNIVDLQCCVSFR